MNSYMRSLACVTTATLLLSTSGSAEAPVSYQMVGSLIGLGAGLMRASDGMLYGTTSSGGPNGGSVFRVDPGTGAITTIYSFTDGARLAAALVEGSDGLFYG